MVEKTTTSEKENEKENTTRKANREEGRSYWSQENEVITCRSGQSCGLIIFLNFYKIIHIYKIESIHKISVLIILNSVHKITHADRDAVYVSGIEKEINNFN